MSAPSPASSDSKSSPTQSPTDDKPRSNYYFFKSTPAEEAKKYMPTLLTDTNDASAATPAPAPLPSQSPPPASEGSKWNAAGTWEERDMTQWAHERVKQLLSDVKPTSSHAITVTCTTVSGDATLVYTRGKKKAGYDLSITCEWTASVSGSDDKVKGAVELPSIDATSDGDFEMIVTVKDRSTASDDAVDDMQRAVKKSIDVFRKRIAQFEQELRDQ